MDISDLDTLEQSVKRLLAQAREDMEKEKLRQQRERQIQEFLEKIQNRLQPLLAEVEATLEAMTRNGVDNPKIRQQLEEKAAEIRQELADAPNKALDLAERQFLLQEERLVEEREAREVEIWRHQLKEDLLDMIAEQDDFYSATDAAIAVKGYVSDLKAIGALEEVVDALMQQINENSEEGPVARLRGTHEQTLTFIYNKALENRSRVDRPPNVQPATRHRKSERKPSLYTDLEGKVLVFGGHDRLESAVRNRLRDSCVALSWATEQGGLQLAAQVESQIPGADLILIVTGYASHSLTERAMESCKRHGQPYEIINTTGMTRLLEAIESGLKTRQLAKRWRSA